MSRGRGEGGDGPLQKPSGIVSFVPRSVDPGRDMLDLERKSYRFSARARLEVVVGEYSVICVVSSKW